MKKRGKVAALQQEIQGTADWHALSPLCSMYIFNATRPFMVSDHFLYSHDHNDFYSMVTEYCKEKLDACHSWGLTL